MRRLFRRSLPAVLGALALTPVPGVGRQATNESLDSLLSIPVRTVTRYAQTTREAPASVSIITRDEIERFGYRSVAEALSTLRGFYVTSDHTYTYLGVRGFGRPSDNNNRVLLLVDGLAYNSVLNGEATLDVTAGVPIEHVERIEVARGPGSALYGSNAMLATVNVVTRRSSTSAPIRLKTELDAGGAGQAVASLSTELRPGIELSGFVQWYDDPGRDLAFPISGEGDVVGVAHGRDYTEYSSWLVSARVRGLAASVSHRDSGQGDPTAPYGSVFDSPGTFREAENTRIDLVYEHDDPSRVGLRVALGYQTGTARARFDFAEPIPDRMADLSARRWGGEAQVRFDLTPSNRLVAGAELRRLDPEIRTGFAPGPIQPVGDPIDLGSVFVQDELQLTTTVALVAGARLDRYTGSAARVSPRVAMVHHPTPGTALKVLFGEAFRAPTPLERFASSPPILYTNPKLAPEGIRTLEVVWEQRLSGAVQATVSAYDYHLKGLIAQAPDEELGGLSYQNAGHLDGRGVGIGIDGRFGRETTVTGSLFVQSLTSEDEMPAPNAPGVLARAGVSTRLPWGARVGARVAYDASRETVHGATLDAVTLVDVDVRSPAWGPFEAALSVRNLFDRSYLLPGGFEHAYLGIPQDGRRLRLSITASF